MKRELNAHTVWFNVMSAKVELECLWEDLEEECKTRPNAFYLEDVTAGHLLASMDHAFHHLNFAWNARYGSMPAVDSDTRFYANEKWPRAARFLRFWPDRWVRAIRKAHQKGVQTRRNSKH